MAKRMKYVFSGSQLAHVWAAQTQEEGRTRGGNFYFNAGGIWSYGSHYLAARFHETPQDGSVVLINEHRYSMQTGMALRHIETATSHLNTFHVSDPSSPKTSVIDMQANIADELMGVLNQNKPYFYADIDEDGDSCWLLQRVDKFNELCQLFNLEKYQLEIPDDFIELLLSHVEIRNLRDKELNTPEMIAKREAATAKRNERKQEILKMKLAEQITAWTNGENLGSWALRSLTPVLIRVKGNVVQTSGGAEVPLKAALKLLKSVQNGTVEHGDRVGSFRYDERNNGTVKIGCHTIEVAHAEKILAAHVSKLKLVTA